MTNPSEKQKSDKAEDMTKKNLKIRDLNTLRSTNTIQDTCG